MPKPTPGEVAYAAYWQCLSQHPALVTVPRMAWDALHEAEQAAWEAAWEALRDVRRYVRAVIRHWHACGPGDGFAEPLHALETWLEAQQPQEDTPHA